MDRWGFPLSITLVFAIIGCAASDLTLPGTPGAPSSITVVKGNGQEAPAGTPLPDPLIVKVTDVDGNPVPEQQVDFILAEELPGSRLTPDAVTTGPDGTAESRWVLGENGGTQQVKARVVSAEAPGVLEALFTASAVVPPRGADRLALSRQPSATARAGVRLERQPVVQIQDAGGADIAAGGVPVTAAVAAGNGVLAGNTTQLTDGAGRAEFTNITIEGSTGDHLLIFAADGHASVSSDVITVNAAPGNGGGRGGGGDDDDNDPGNGGGGGRGGGNDDDGGGGRGGDDGDDDDEGGRGGDDDDDDDDDSDEDDEGDDEGRGGRGNGGGRDDDNRGRGGNGNGGRNGGPGRG